MTLKEMAITSKIEERDLSDCGKTGMEMMPHMMHLLQQCWMQDTC